MIGDSNDDRYAQRLSSVVQQPNFASFISTGIS